MEEQRESRVIYINTSVDYRRGDLNFIELPDDIGFDVRRIFWVSKNRDGKWRGGHAHKVCQQVLIAVSGTVIVEADDVQFTLDSPDKGLFIPAGTYIAYKLYNIYSVLLVLASEHYDKEDYINAYQVS